MASNHPGNKVVERDFRSINRAIRGPGSNALKVEIRHLDGRTYEVEVNDGLLVGAASKTKSGWSFTWRKATHFGR